MSLHSVSIVLTGIVFLGIGVQSLSAAEKNNNVEQHNEDHRALFNYQMLCQGCHAADGRGYKSVPELKGSIHKFMATQKGREYLIRVPGAANAALNDRDLAEVMNWMLRRFSDNAELTWQPYEALEVGEYRKRPLNETVKYRESLIMSMKLESEL